MNHVEADVCIIGAGLAGLAAAYKLRKEGLSVAVLEARDRVGGRVFSEILPDGTPLNWGGTWLGDGHDRMYELVGELGLETYPQYDEGDNVMVRGETASRSFGPVPNLEPQELLSLGVAMQALEELAADVPVDAPWDAEQARAWDSETLGGWIDSPHRVPTRAARETLRSLWNGVFMSDPSEVSLLHALQMIHSLGGHAWITGNEGGAQQDLVVGGSQSIANRIAEILGDAMHLDTPVRRVRQDDDGVEVTSDRVTVRAGRAIIAIPPTLAGRIEYEPELPRARTQLMDRSPAGQAVRCNAVYAEPFWRAEGLTGEGPAYDSLIRMSLDVTPPSGAPGVLTAYAMGTSARVVGELPPEERRELFLAGLVQRFGPKAADPIYYEDREWTTEEWSRGAMFAHYAPGVLTGFGRALREPCGRIHWAGTETATQWSGSMEGAVRSGERAADEVMAAD